MNRIKKNNFIALRVSSFPEKDFLLTVRNMWQYCPLLYHCHENFLEMVLVTGGRATHCLENEERKIAAGDFLVIPLGVWHTYTNCVDFRYYNILAVFDSIPLPLIDLSNKLSFKKIFFSEKASCLHFQQAVFERCYDLLINLKQILTLRSDGYRFSAICRLMQLLELICQEYETQHKIIQTEPFGEMLEIERYINKNFRNAINIEELCQLSNMSRSVLFRKFQKYFAVSPLNFILNLRLQHSSTLLTLETLSVGEIANLCGFKSQSYFTAKFRQKYGMTPLQFRQLGQDVYDIKSSE